jgi:[ribosomal protein S18]-alanine N-acetyltransferase
MTRRLRPIESPDLAALARMHALCFPEDRWDEKALAELLAIVGASGHLIEDTTEGRPLGFVMDIILAAAAEILTLAVVPAFRRQGVARALLADLEARARRAGTGGISLEVAADNRAAQQLYESVGFVQSGRRRGYYRRGRDTVDALLFRRVLLP